MISHGMLPHFAPFYQICAFLETVCIFCPFPQNVVNAKFKQTDGHGERRDSHEKVNDNFFAKSVGTLVQID